MLADQGHSLEPAGMSNARVGRPLGLADRADAGTSQDWTVVMNPLGEQSDKLQAS